MMSRDVLGAVAVAVLSCAGACGLDRGAVGELGMQCVEGLATACRCSDGARGVSTCSSDGIVGPCECSPALAGAGGGTTGSGSPGGAAGTAASEAPDAGGGGVGAQGGSGPGGGNGGSSGPGGSGGGNDEPDAGQPNGGDGGGPKEDAGGGEPKPGGPYARCENGDQCEGALVCAPPPFANGIGYCTSDCVPGGGADQCPAPPSGSVGAVCGPLNALCQLQSCRDLECPHGMECFEEMVVSFPFMTTVYYCAYPS